MKNPSSFAVLLEGFFTERLMHQRQASPHTIASYRDTFRLLLQYTEKHLRKSPSRLTFEEIDAPLLAAFLNDLEKTRGITPRSRNLRLTAIRSFFHYAAYETPAHSAQIQRVLAIPGKRHDRVQIHFLTRAEVDALLNAPDRETRSGRRDHALLMVAVQTGLRLSELTGLKRQDVIIGTGAHLRCMGKGRKERCTLLRKNVTPHVLRHTTAMELLQAGVDRAVIALWLGHESVETTQIYLDANLALKEEILAKTKSLNGGKPGRYKPDDELLAFLKGL